MLTLDRHVEELFLWHKGRIVIVFGFLKIDQTSLFESDHPDPLRLRVLPGTVVFFRTGIDTPSTADAPGKIEAVSPECIWECLLGAHTESLLILLKIPLFQAGDEIPFFFIRELEEVLLKKIFSLFLGAGGKDWDGNSCSGGSSQCAEKFSPGIELIGHVSFPSVSWAGVRALWL